MLNDVVTWYENQSNMALRLGVSPAAVSQWMRDGFLPPARALQVEQQSEGKFKAIDLVQINN